MKDFYRTDVQSDRHVFESELKMQKDVLFNPEFQSSLLSCMGKRLTDSYRTFKCPVNLFCARNKEILPSKVLIHEINLN